MSFTDWFWKVSSRNGLSVLLARRKKVKIMVPVCLLSAVWPALSTKYETYGLSLYISREKDDHIRDLQHQVFHGRLQTAKCHVTTALRSRLQFAFHVWNAVGASSGKRFTARFFATKNYTASRLKVWTSFLYPFAMCLLDFWSRINELLLSFGRLKWYTSTWWKQHGGPKQWMGSNQFYIPSAVH